MSGDIRLQYASEASYGNTRPTYSNFSLRVSWVQVHQEHILLHSALHRDTASWGVIITQENVGTIGDSRADMKKTKQWNTTSNAKQRKVS